MIDGIQITNLNIVEADSGAVMHILKSKEESFVSFKEAYFSTCNYKHIKAWKRHKKMTLNLVIASGIIKFVLYDDRKNSTSFGMFEEYILSIDNYYRLTVPPMIWTGFQGIGRNENKLINIADYHFDATEVDRLDIKKLSYNWE